MPYDFKSDMWSLGCVLYEMMSLKHAFDAADMSSLVMKILRGEHLPIPQVRQLYMQPSTARGFGRKHHTEHKAHKELPEDALAHATCLFKELQALDGMMNAWQAGITARRGFQSPARPVPACAVLLLLSCLLLQGYSQELKDLVRQLLCKNPKMRPSAEQILKMPFLKVLGARRSLCGSGVGEGDQYQGRGTAPTWAFDY